MLPYCCQITLTNDFESKFQEELLVAIMLAPVAPSPRYNWTTTLSKALVVRRETNVMSTLPHIELLSVLCKLIVILQNIQLVSSSVTTDFTWSGIATWCVTLGEYRYSIRVNRPSGGTKDSCLSRVQRCILLQRLNNEYEQTRFAACLPHARMKRTLRHILNVCKVK